MKINYCSSNSWEGIAAFKPDTIVRAFCITVYCRNNLSSEDPLEWVSCHRTIYKPGRYRGTGIDTKGVDGELPNGVMLHALCEFNSHVS